MTIVCVCVCVRVHVRVYVCTCVHVHLCICYTTELNIPILKIQLLCFDQLEEKCLTAEKDITIQTRKNIDLKKQLKKSQTEVKELRKEVHQCLLYKPMTSCYFNIYRWLNYKSLKN